MEVGLWGHGDLADTEVSKGECCREKSVPAEVRSKLNICPKQALGAWLVPERGLINRTWARPSLPFFFLAAYPYGVLVCI